MPRKKRDFRERTHLAQFLHDLLKKHHLTIKALADIAGVSPSVVQGWRHGSFPAENVGNVKKLCNQFGYSLSFVLTGEPDEITGNDPLSNYLESEWFDGYAKIKIIKLIPRTKAKF